MAYNKIQRKIKNEFRWREAHAIQKRYAAFTMISPDTFAHNLLICQDKAPTSGCIVECGVWRGGMSAGMADALPSRRHYLLDSFEGLPPAKAIDGDSAIAWQQDTNSPSYYDNCTAERSFAEQAMLISKAREFDLVQGWFSDTVPAFKPAEPIAVLRLDGDWYDSTMQCLSGLYTSVLPGGLIIIDDYYAWEGCARAVHDFLSRNELTDRLQEQVGVCFWIKRG